MSNEHYVVEVNDLCKSFNQHKAVKNLSLKIRQGEIFGFLGPNGSGKTTTIRMMCGLLTPDSGSGNCLGFDIIKQQDEIKHHIGYMTQKFSYWEDLTIRQNLDFVARLYQIKNKKVIIDQTLEDLQLAARANQLAGTLSGGWKQRLALAASMIHQPKLIFLDEPTAGVDPTARRAFWEELHRLASMNVSILVSTHYMDEAERCHKLAYISQGSLLCQGTAEELIKQKNLSTWRIIGENLVKLASQLEKYAGIEQVAVFGTSLHVSGTDNLILNEIMTYAVISQGYRAEKIDTSLEDVFINLMKMPGNKVEFNEKI